MNTLAKSIIKILCFTIVIVAVILIPPFFSMGEIPPEPIIEIQTNNSLDNKPEDTPVVIEEEFIRGIPKGSEVVVIGDSITEGSKIAIEEILPGVLVEAQKNKTVAASLEEGQGGDSGLRIAKQLKSTNKLRKYVVFALGTNSGIKEEHIDALEEIVGPDRKLIFVNLYITPDKVEKAKLFKSFNRVLFLSTITYDNITIADWEAAAGESPSKYIANDGLHVHPSHPAGTELFAETIYDTLSEIWEVGNVRIGK
jgi:lysophospholipase L1-like esterase